MNDNSVTIYSILKYWLKKRSVLGNLVGTRSLHVKVHPGKKPQSKKTRRCPIVRCQSSLPYLRGTLGRLSRWSLCPAAKSSWRITRSPFSVCWSVKLGRGSRSCVVGIRVRPTSPMARGCDICSVGKSRARCCASFDLGVLSHQGSPVQREVADYHSLRVLSAPLGVPRG
jgi:hypothetical protein